MSGSQPNSTRPSGLNSGALSSRRRKSSTGTNTPPSSTKRGSVNLGGNTKSKEDGGNGLIVTRGLQEILDRDLKYGKALEANQKSESPQSSKSRRRSTGQAPNFINCYLCGRQFGTASIDIHRPQCYLKKMIEWERGDPAIRGPKPLSPEEHEKMMKHRAASMRAANGAIGGAGGFGGSFGGGGHPGASRLSGMAGANSRASEIAAYNQLQMEAFNDTALAPCPNCGRTFLPDRLQVHLRSCKPGHAARPVPRRTSVPTMTSGANANNNTSLAAPSMKSPPPKTAAAADVQDRPIRASGAYNLPAGAGADDVPPASATASIDNTAGAGGRAPSSSTVAAPSSQPIIARSRPTSLSNNAHGVNEAMSEEAEPRDTVMEIDLDEGKPPSPRADFEHRLSSAAILRGDPDMSGSSAPNRPASMEPTSVSTALSADNAADIGATHASLSQSRGREHAAGSRPRHPGSTSAPRSMPLSDVLATTDEHTHAEEGESARGESAPHGATDEIFFEEEEAQARASEKNSDRRFSSSAGVVVECDPMTLDAIDASGAASKKPWTPKKIPLNNVSHFKSVESRLGLQRESEKVSLVPCKFCGRTFVPERVRKHEECCVDRHKPPTQRAGNHSASRPSSAPAAQKRAKPASSASLSTATATSAAAAPSPTMSSSAPPAEAKNNTSPASATHERASAATTATGKAKFCGSCGMKLGSGTQTFCTQCGFKLL